MKKIKIRGEHQERVHNLPERIMCAAVYYDDGREYHCQPVNIKTGFVVCGHRHFNCLVSVSILNGKDIPYKKGRWPKWLYDRIYARNTKREYVATSHGFLTTKNRYLNREGALALARTYLRYLPSDKTALYSEDLW